MRIPIKILLLVIALCIITISLIPLSYKFNILKEDKEFAPVFGDTGQLYYDIKLYNNSAEINLTFYYNATRFSEEFNMPFNENEFKLISIHDALGRIDKYELKEDNLLFKTNYDKEYNRNNKNNTNINDLQPVNIIMQTSLDISQEQINITLYDEEHKPFILPAYFKNTYLAKFKLLTRNDYTRTINLYSPAGFYIFATLVIGDFFSNKTFAVQNLPPISYESSEKIVDEPMFPIYLVSTSPPSGYQMKEFENYLIVFEEHAIENVTNIIRQANSYVHLIEDLTGIKKPGIVVVESFTLTPWQVIVPAMSSRNVIYAWPEAFSEKNALQMFVHELTHVYTEELKEAFPVRAWFWEGIPTFIQSQIASSLKQPRTLCDFRHFKQLYLQNLSSDEIYRRAGEYSYGNFIISAYIKENGIEAFRNTIKKMVELSRKYCAECNENKLIELMIESAKKSVSKNNTVSKDDILYPYKNTALENAQERVDAFWQKTKDLC